MVLILKNSIKLLADIKSPPNLAAWATIYRWVAPALANAEIEPILQEKEENFA